VFGSLVGEVEDFLAETPELQEFFGMAEDGALAEAFLSTVMLLLGLLATGYALAAASRLRSEETAGRAEPLLATAITRWRWAAGHLAVAMLGGAAVLLATAAGLGIVAAIQLGDASWVASMLGAGVARVPAMWFVVGVTVALYGLVPRVAAFGWAVLGYAAVVGFLGDTLDLPDGARALSPFHHVPELPGGDVEVTGLLVLTATAAGLVLIGWAALRRRDVNVA
jgi:ABC-2 type transport system permease protein